MTPRRAWLLATTAIAGALCLLPATLRAQTLDLAGASVALPKSPSFPNAFLSGSNNVTNSVVTPAGATPTLREGGGTAATAIYSGNIADGAGQVFLTHTSGVTVLSGHNTYSGDTNINGGTLQAGSATGLSSNSIFYVNTGGALDVHGFNPTLATVLGNGVITNNGSTASTLSISGSYSATMYGSIVDGSSKLGLNIAQGTLALANQDPNSTTLTPNTYSGGTTIGPAGTLQLGDGSFIGNAGSGAVVNNGTLTFDQGVDQAHPNSQFTFANNISGSGAVTQIGGGTVILSGANSYTGGTIVDDTNGYTQLMFASAGAAPTTGLILLRTNNQGAVAGTTYAIDQAFLNKLDPASVGVAALGADSGNALDFTSLPGVNLGAVGACESFQVQEFCVTRTYSGALMPAGAGNSYNFGGGNAILNVSSNLGDIGSSTSLSHGANNTGGYTILSGTNTYSGGTFIDSGILQFAAPAALPNAGSSSIAISGNGVAAAGYAIDQTFLNSIVSTSQGTAALAVDSSNNLDFNAAGLGKISLGAVGGGATFSGTISPYVTPGTQVGTFYLGGGESNAMGSNGQMPPNAYLYVTSVLSNANAASGINNLVVNSQAFTNPINVVLLNDETFTGTTLVDNGFLQLGNSQTNGNLLNSSLVTISSGGTLAFNEASAVTFAPPIAGAGNFEQFGPGAVTLTAPTTYTGETFIAGGALIIGPLSTIGSSSQVILFNSPASPTSLDISGAGAQAVQNLFADVNTTVKLGANTLTIGVVGANYVGTPFYGNPTFFNGVFSGTTGGLVFQGNGIYTLGGTSNYSGSTVIAAGTLQAMGANVFSPNSVFDPKAGATLDLNGFNQTIGGLDPNGPGKTNGTVTNNGATPAVLTFGGTNASTSFFGTFSDGTSGGTLGLTKTGTGSFTFAGSSSYSGATDIQAGTFIAGATNALSVKSAFTVETGATLNLNGYDQAIGSLAGAGTIENLVTGPGAALTIGGSGASSSFGGLIEDGGAPLKIVKTGAGVWTVTSANTYTGGTKIAGGEVSITNAGALGTGQVWLANGTTLQFQGTGYTFANPTQIGFIAGDPTIDSGPGVISMAGVLSGPAALTKIGTGTLILTNAANTYIGGTNVNVGTLQVDGSISSSSVVTIASGATLSGIGAVGAIAASAGATVAPGNLGNPYNGLLATGSATFAPGSTLLVNASVPNVSLLTVRGAASLQPGAAVLVNLAAGTYLPTTKYTILTAAGGVTGTFGAATIATPSAYVPVLSYDPNDVFLQFQPAADPLPSLQVLAGDHTGLIVTNRILGSILGGFNEQINCSNCISAFGAVGSFSAGFHGRKALTDDLSLLGGFAYTNFSSGGAHVTSSPMFAAALRYDWTEMGALRPFAEVGGVAAPWQATNFARPYVSGTVNASGTGSSNAGNYSVFGKLGVVDRLTQKDEIAADIELSHAWQTFGGYTEASGPSDPNPAVMRGGVDTMNIVKLGGQWTHLFAPSVETQINLGVAGSFGSTSGIVADFTGTGGNVLSPKPGERAWVEYGLRVGYRLSKENVIDVFIDGTLGPKPIGDTMHGGVALRHIF